MNALDKLISSVAPDWALQRAISRRDLEVVNSWCGRGGAYEGGNSSRKRKQASGARSRAGTEDANAGTSLENMRLEAMDLYRNNPIAKAIVDVTRRYARQSRPRANTAAYVSEDQKQAAKEWDNRATDRFNAYWWNRADAHRRPGVTFGTLQDMYITTQFTQGDLAYVWTGNGFALIEGMQINTPYKLQADKSISNGFKRNAAGQLTHMYYNNWGDQGFLDKSVSKRLSMLSVLFCPWYWRGAQLRAVPRLHGIIDALRDAEEIHSNVKQKVKQEAALLSIERSGTRKNVPGSRIANSDGTEVTYEKSDWGMRFKTNGKPGDDFTFANGVTPHAQYVPLMEYDTKIISAGVGIPYKAIMSLFDGSWSSNKSVQAALKMYIAEIWENRINTFSQRAWNLLIANDIRAGVLPAAPVDSNGFSLFNRAEWSRPYFPQLDQEKEERGRAIAFRNMTQSPEDWADEQGTTAESLYERHKESMRKLKADAEELGIPFETYAAGLIANSSSVSATTQTTNEAME